MKPSWLGLTGKFKYVLILGIELKLQSQLRMLKVNKLTTMYDSCTIFIDVSAIEILDLWGKDENGDETNGYKKLAK